jgi:hypothetical protein
MTSSIFTHAPNFIIKIVEINVDKSKHIKDAEYIRLWNSSFLGLSVLFFLIAIVDFLLVASEISYCFSLLGIIYFSLIFTDLKFNKLAQTFAYLMLIFVFFFISSSTGLQSGIYFYYLPLLVSLPGFLNFKEDRRAMIFIVLCLLFVILLDFTINTATFQNSEILFLESAIGSIALVLMSLYFTMKKQYLIINYYKSKTEKYIPTDKLTRVVELAKNGSPAFFTEFKSLYPNLTEKLVEIQPNTIASELEFFAYLKLNFSTKEIAKFTNSTVRSVEARKYRIRKKFNISEKIDIYVWASNL